MPKDIRKILENYSEESVDLSENHSNRFESKLMKELHQEEKPKSKRTGIYWLSIAASLALLVTLGIHFFDFGKDDPILADPKPKVQNNQISLGNISPELNTIETYYINSINLELSQLELTDDNKELIDSYLEKLGELTEEYKSLTQELNTKGVNDETIDALITNLQLRLQLMKRLKKQLNTLKEVNSKNNEIIS
jgi:SOS response regulatory protein OraA/RecX